MAARTLIMLGGLPGTGKSTVAAVLQQRATLVYVRIDSIEHALRLSGELIPPGPVTAGYEVGYAITRDLFRVDCHVLVECVNPIALTRDAWRRVAADSGAELMEIELRCSNTTMHRYRVENRESDFAGFELPRWNQVSTRVYEPWPDANLRIDTAVQSPAATADAILAALPNVSRRPTG